MTKPTLDRRQGTGSSYCTEGKVRQEKSLESTLFITGKGTWVGLTELHGEKVWDACELWLGAYIS